MTSQTSKVERLEGLLKQANEDIRGLSEEIQIKSATAGREKSGNEANTAGMIERMKIDFELKLEERDEQMKQMFMRIGFKINDS